MNERLKILLIKRFIKNKMPFYAVIMTLICITLALHYNEWIIAKGAITATWGMAALSLIPELDD